MLFAMGSWVWISVISVAVLLAVAALARRA